MKKKVLAIICAMTLVFGISVNAMAADSPVGDKVTTETTDKASKAPKTGESNMLIYAVAGALLLSGTAVVSRKRLEALR